MNIYFIEPLSQGWSRMKKALFQPFDIKKWFVVGLTSFLAGLVDDPGPGSSSFSDQDHFRDMRDIVDFPGTAWEWLMTNTGWFIFITFAVLAVLGIVIFLFWLSSRGKFMFLDNVLHDRAEVTKPWHEYRNAGNSLFLWRLAFSAISFAAVISSVVISFIMISNIYWGNLSGTATIYGIIGLVLVFFSLIVVIAYISLFLNDFVIPIMYKNRFTAMEAWNHFLPLFMNHFWYFTIYGLFKLLLWILIGIFIVIAGCYTCCIAFLLLVIPYIGSVFILPVTYTFRAFSVEFLGQFGKEFSLFAESDDLSETEGDRE